MNRAAFLIWCLVVVCFRSIPVAHAAPPELESTASPAAPAEFSPSEELNKARLLYRSGNLEAVLEILTGPDGILGEQPRLSDPQDLHRACVLAASAEFYQSNEDAARGWFRRAIQLQPRRRLDPLRTPAPLVQLFDEVLGNMERPLRRRLVVDVFPELLPQSWERGQYTLGFIPFFGIGYDQLRSPVIGNIVRVLEVAGAAGSFATFVQLVRLRLDPDPERNPERYRLLGLNVGFVIAFYTALLVDILGSLWLRQYRKTYPERTPPSRRFSDRRIQVSLGGSGLSLAFW